MAQYRGWLGELPPEVAQRIAWGNGAALFGLGAVGAAPPSSSTGEGRR